jgi:Protein of unknown function (DUF3313)
MVPTRMKPFVSLALASGFVFLGACSTTAPIHTNSSLSTTEGMVPGKAGRARTLERRDVAALNQVKKVYINPVRLMTGEAPRYVLTDVERDAILKEVAAQLCFELSERYEIVDNKSGGDASVSAAVTWFEPTGIAGSGAAAAVNFFIPGPIGMRVPGTLGGLGAEAEMIGADQKQLAALIWARKAQAVGTDSPSLTRLGDALQFAEPFADEAARIMSPDPMPAKRTYRTEDDPCRHFGGRVNETGMVGKAVTGLYTPPGRDTKTKDE